MRRRLVSATVCGLIAIVGSVRHEASLPGADSDRDGVPDAVDCAPNDPLRWSAPSEVRDVRFDPGPGTTLAWQPPADLGGDPSAVVYEVLRSSDPEDFVGKLGCVELSATDAAAEDPRTPPEGGATYYVVRAVSCEAGDPGSDSSGSPRTIGPFTAVTNLDAGGSGSLAQRIADAQPGDLICVAEPGTLTLAGSPLLVDKSLTIRGSGEEVLVVDGNGLSSVFDVTSGDVTIADLTVTGAPAGQPGLSISSTTFKLETSTARGNGGGGLALGSVSTDVKTRIEHATIADNSGTGVNHRSLSFTNELHVSSSRVTGNGDRGIDFLNGTLLVSSSTVNDNADLGIGRSGGVGSTYSVTVDSSEVSGNEAGVGVVGPFGDVVISRTLISGNTGPGVSIGYYNNTVVRESTIAGNGLGIEALYYGYAFTIRDSTIADNVGFGLKASYQQTPALRNTVLARNGQNCLAGDGFGTIGTFGWNLSDDVSCHLDGPGDQPNTPAMLGPLADNGGPTGTYLPLPGSPVLDAGSCTAGSTDQRGLPRPVDLADVPNQNPSACDIGAVELQASMGSSLNFDIVAMSKLRLDP